MQLPRHMWVARRYARTVSRMQALLAYVDQHSCLSTPEYVAKFGTVARQDLQRLWEDGLVVRYRFTECHGLPNWYPAHTWYWASLDEVRSWGEDEIADLVQSGPQPALLVEG